MIEMKIISLIIFFTVMLNTSYYVQANTIDASGLINVVDDKNIYMGKSLDHVKNIQYVGNGYIIMKQDTDICEEILFTNDFVDFKTISLYNDANSFDTFSRMGNMDEIIWMNNGYIARSNVYDNVGKSGRVLEDYSYLYFLNEQFDLTNKIKFDHYIKEMSYINGYCYICVSNESYLQENNWGYKMKDVINTVLKTNDFQNWEKCEQLEHVPISNDNNSIVLNGYKIFLFKNNMIAEQIVYEDVVVSENKSPYSDTAAQKVLNKVGEYFYIVDNAGKGIWMSQDGVYFTKFLVPYDEWENGIDIIYNINAKSYIIKENINNYMPDNNIYIKINNCILGFETPPVIEDDRTLVPMRFLFEQMGANVEWNQDTMTATATMNNATVEFSINNTNAEVNGTAATMEVPARLVNGKTMVPLRFLSEELGYTVTWDDETRTAVIE